MQRLLRHMTWANQRVFAAVEALDPEALTSYLVNPEWTVAVILQHLVGGAEWYGYCLTTLHDGWERVCPTSAADVATLATELVRFDERIIAHSALADDLLTFTDEHGTHQAYRTTIVAQAVHHATEHRAQLVDALEFRGYRAINLDDLDLWAFEDFEGRPGA